MTLENTMGSFRGGLVHLFPFLMPQEQAQTTARGAGQLFTMFIAG